MVALSRVDNRRHGFDCKLVSNCSIPVRRTELHWKNAVSPDDKAEALGTGGGYDDDVLLGPLEGIHRAHLRIIMAVVCQCLVIVVVVVAAAVVFSCVASKNVHLSYVSGGCITQLREPDSAFFFFTLRTQHVLH